MQFDSSIKAQQEIRRTLGLDPRMIRFSVVKIGDKLGGVNGAIEDVTGDIPWNSGQVPAHIMRPFQQPGVAR